MQTEILKVSGLTSESCVDRIMHALAGVAGVKDATVSLLRSQVVVQFDEQVAAIGQMKAALANAGYAVFAIEPAELGQGSCCGGCCS